MCNEQPTILLADDDVDDQDLLKEAILLAGPAVKLLVFNNGREIIDFLEVNNQGSPCLIVLDYNMPYVNGLQVLEKITGSPRLRTVPTIVWSTSTSPLYQQRCLDTGALKYIIKPNDSRAYNRIAQEMVSICCGV